MAVESSYEANLSKEASHYSNWTKIWCDNTDSSEIWQKFVKIEGNSFSNYEFSTKGEIINAPIPLLGPFGNIVQTQRLVLKQPKIYGGLCK